MYITQILHWTMYYIRSHYSCCLMKLISSAEKVNFTSKYTYHMFSLLQNSLELQYYCCLVCHTYASIIIINNGHTVRFLKAYFYVLPTACKQIIMVKTCQYKC